jgi:hypothetical protein
MREPFDELAFTVGCILRNHIPKLRKRQPKYARLEDEEECHQISKEIADYLRRWWCFEKPPRGSGHTTP